MASEQTVKCRQKRRKPVAVRPEENSRKHAAIGRQKCATKSPKKIKTPLSFCCRLCSEAFRRHDDYDDHWSLKHTDSSRMLMFTHPALCDQCGKTFSSVSALSCHKARRKNCKEANHVNNAQLPTATAFITSEEALDFKTDIVQAGNFNTDNNSTGVSVDPNFDQHFINGDYKQENQTIVYGKRMDDKSSVDKTKSLDCLNKWSDKANCLEDGLKDDVKNNDNFVKCESPETVEIASSSNVKSEPPNVEFFEETSHAITPSYDNINIDNNEKYQNTLVWEKSKKGRPLYTCRICSTVFGGVKKYRVHFVTTHRDFPVEDMFESGWKCSVCGSVHSNVYGLRSHWLASHPDMYDKVEFNEFVKNQTLEKL